MKDATEKEKEEIVDNIIKVYGMPDTFKIAFNGLWNHQIPESAKEWINNLAEMKERLDEIEKEKDRLNKEYTAQCYIGMGLFAILEEEEKDEDRSYQEV